MSSWLRRAGRRAVGSTVGSLVAGPIGGTIGGVVGGIDNLGRKTSNVAGDAWDQVSGHNTNQAIRDAAHAQQSAADADRQGWQKNFDTIRQDGLNQWQQTQDNLQPWLQSGKQALAGMNDFSSNYKAPTFNFQDTQKAPTAMTDFKYDPSQLGQDPGYQFRLKQGQDAIQRSAAGHGLLHSGNTLAALNDYTQGQASNEFQNSFGRAYDTYNQNYKAFQGQQDQYNKNRLFDYGSQLDSFNLGNTASQQRFNNLATMAGYGQNAANSLGNFSSALGNSMANAGTNYTTGMNNANDSYANAYGGSRLGVANNNMNTTNQFMNLFGQGAGLAGKYFGGA
jgi:hypothetical protein